MSDSSIDNLNPLPADPASGDNLVITNGGITYKVDYADFFASVIGEEITADIITALDTFVFSDGSTQTQAGASNGTTGFIETAHFLNSFPTVNDNSLATDVAFRQNGTKMYVSADGPPPEINEYDLSTPWDISTAVFSTNFDLTTVDDSPSSLTFKHDGTVMYVIGLENDNLYGFPLTTPWDVSSADVNTVITVDIGNPQPVATGVWFKPDGKSFYIIGTGGSAGTIDRFDLTNPWDIVDATAVSTFDVTAQELTPQSITFRTDGTRMYIIGTTNNTVFEYLLTTPWDITTASLLLDSLDVSSVDTDMTGIWLREDSAKIYFSAFGGDNNISEFDIGIKTGGNLIVGNTIEAPNITATDSYEYADGSTQPYATLPNNILGDVTTGVLTNTITFTDLQGNTTGLWLSNDRLTLLVLDSASGNSKVRAYSLTVPGDISTMNLTAFATFDVNTIDTAPQGFFWSADGLRMYMVGIEGDPTVYQFELTTPFDITTMTDTGKSLDISLGSTLSQVRGISFKPNGKIMLALDLEFRTIYQWELSANWDITTGTQTNGEEFTFNVDLTGIQDMFASSSGTKYYIVDIGTDKIYQVDLTTPWEVTSSIENLEEFLIIPEENVLASLYIDQINSKLYTAGAITNNLYESNLGLVTEGSVNIGNNQLAAKLSVQGNTDSSAYIYSNDTTQDQAAVPSNDTGCVDTSLLIQEVDIPDTDVNDGSGLFFHPNGTDMYVAAFSPTAEIFQYPLSTPWDASTLGTSSSFVLTGWESCSGVFLRQDGLKMYATVVDAMSAAFVLEFDLTTAWDITTATNEKELALTLSTGTSIAEDIFFRPDGTTFFITDADGDTVVTYPLSTPWDITSALTSSAFGVVSVNPTCIEFRSDGTKMYVLGSTDKILYEYILTTPWDTSSALLDGITLDVSQENASPNGIFVRQNGESLYILESNTGLDSFILQYNMGLRADSLRAASLVQSLSIVQANGGFIYSDGSAQQNAASPSNLQWDVTTAKIEKSQLIGAGDYRKIFFKTDGTKIYWVNRSSTGTIEEAPLTTPWDITTKGTTTATASPDTSPEGIYIRNDGLKMLILTTGIGGVTLNEHNLTTAWDTTTLGAPVNTVSYEGVDVNMVGLDAHPDGRTFYMTGLSTGTLYQVNALVTWSLAGLEDDVTDNSFVLGDNQPTGLFFKYDGTKFYTTGIITDVIEQYELNVPWDITNVQQKDSLDVSTQDVTPAGCFLKPDGTKLYMTGVVTSTFFEYDMGIQIEGNTKLNGPLTATVTNVTDNLSSPVETLFLGVSDVSTGTLPRTIIIQTSDITAQKIIIIKDETGGAFGNHIRIEAEDSQPIDGEGFQEIDSNYGVIRLYSNGIDLFTW